MDQHKRNIHHLQDMLQGRGERPVVLAKGKTNSNLTRASHYKDEALRLDVSQFDRILEVDVARKIARVEPRVSMQELFAKTAQVGLMPKVVPEFCGITVGGAINGCGGESSSHACGLLHDTCASYELLLGSGDVIQVSDREHRELFHAIHGSYGSLGLLLSAEIPLIEVQPYVCVKPIWFQDPQEAITYLQSRPQVDFIEGIIFSPNKAVVLEGTFATTPKKRPVGLSGPTSPWYYHLAEQMQHEEYFTLQEYLFRYDKGAFWMGAYALRPQVLSRVLLHAPLSQEKYAHAKHPGALLRLLTHRATKSQSLYRLLHAVEKWINEYFIIQDFTMPEGTSGEFLHFLQKECPLYPLWLCPVRAAPKEQLFAPHVTEESFCINIGVYGIPKSATPTRKLLAALEKKAMELKGRKWLYAYSQYSLEDFWKIYPEDTYQELRKRYHASGCWMEITDKVL